MKLKTRLALILVMGVCLAVNLMAQKPADMVGTWVGPATSSPMNALPIRAAHEPCCTNAGDPLFLHSGSVFCSNRL
jgi:hypothetical protein